MKKVPTSVVKERSREITKEVDSWDDAYSHLLGKTVTCCIVDTAADKVSVVGHSKTYAQVLLDPNAPDGSGPIMGCVVRSKITWVGRWSVKGVVEEVLYRPGVNTLNVDKLGKDVSPAPKTGKTDFRGSDAVSDKELKTEQPAKSPMPTKAKGETIEKMALFRLMILGAIVICLFGVLLSSLSALFEE